MIVSMKRLAISLILSLASCAAERPQAKTNVIDVPQGAAGDASPSPPTDADEARRLRQEGRQLLEQTAYPEAIAKLEASMKKAPNPELLYDIGRAYELMGKRTEAADTYELYVSKGDLSHMDRMSMELRIKQLRAGQN